MNPAKEPVPRRFKTSEKQIQMIKSIVHECTDVVITTGEARRIAYWSYAGARDAPVDDYSRMEDPT